MCVVDLNFLRSHMQLDACNVNVVEHFNQVWKLIAHKKICSKICFIIEFQSIQFDMSIFIDVRVLSKKFIDWINC